MKNEDTNFGVENLDFKPNTNICFEVGSFLKSTELSTPGYGLYALLETKKIKDLSMEPSNMFKNASLKLQNLNSINKIKENFVLNNVFIEEDRFKKAHFVLNNVFIEEDRFKKAHFVLNNVFIEEDRFKKAHINLS